MEYDICLNQQQLSVLYSGLGELPLKIALPVLGVVQAQQKKQDEEKAPPLDELVNARSATPVP